MKTKIFISLFILYFLGSCSSPVSPGKPSDKFRERSYTNVTFRIKGTITDSTNNSPVVEALVWLNIFLHTITSVRTNIEGHNTIECTYEWDTTYNSVEEGLLALGIEATGYKTKFIDSDAINHVRITEGWQIIDVQLEPGSSSSTFSR